MGYTEIFQKISSTFIQGIMFHSQLMEIFYYLGFCTYGDFHKKQYKDESKNYLKLIRYYSTHYNLILPDSPIETKNLSPLYELEGIQRKDLNLSKEKSLISDCFNSWVNWEQNVKWTLQDMYNELIKINEAAAAIFISKFIEDVDEELAEAERQLFLLKQVDFDLTYIADQQEKKNKEKKGEEDE